MELYLLAAVFLIGIALSFDIALAMLLASVALLLFNDSVPMHLIAEKSATQLALYPLLAIPGFMIAGELMNLTGLTRALGEFARLLVGRWHGGMGYATVLACMIFGGMTGSGLAETVAIGTLMIPMLERCGYPRSVGAAIVASGGSLGPIIPPSIPMVIYASIAPGVSIAALFVGGIVPGIMIGLSFMAVVFWRTRRLELATEAMQEGEENWVKVSLRALPAVFVPVIVLYGSLAGYVTITEASVLAAVYVLLYGLVTRSITLHALGEAARSAANATGLFGFIIAAAGSFSFFLALFQAPELVGKLLLDIAGGNQDVLMLMIVVVLIVLGCLVEATSLVIILAPILAGAATVAGIDPTHMAVVSIAALMLGLFTPPVGTNLFAVVGIARRPIEEISKEIWPFAIAAGLVVIALSLMPSVVTYLPKLWVK